MPRPGHQPWPRNPSQSASGEPGAVHPPDVRAAWEALVAAPAPTIGATIRESQMLLSRDLLGYAPFGFSDVRWQRADLNRDGRPEVLFVLEHPTFCGMARCPLVVMGRVTSRDEWAILCESSAGSGSSILSILPTRTRGWHWFRSEVTTAWREAPNRPGGVECDASQQR